MSTRSPSASLSGDFSETVLIRGQEEKTKRRNIVVFGDSGVGKSSLINMISGKKIAKTSNGAAVCTFMSTRYDVRLDDEEFIVWDTTGLNAGINKHGRADMAVARRTLSSLLQLLRGGIQLLVYVVRGSNVGRALARNYTIFYSAISRKQVPIAVVVTGLENEEGEMEDWWKEGEQLLARYQMHFDAHACVTTLAEEQTRGTMLADRGHHSQIVLRRMIKESCQHSVIEHKDTKLWIKTVLTDVRSLMDPGSRWERQPLTNVVICGGDGSLVNTSIVGEWEDCSTRIDGRPYTFHNVPRALVESGSEGPKFPRVQKPDLLVYVADASPIPEALARLRNFHRIYHGDMCPLVLIAIDQDSAQAWNGQVRKDSISATVTFLPPPNPQNNLQFQQVQDIIVKQCLVRCVSRAASRRSGNAERQPLHVFRRRDTRKLRRRSSRESASDP